MNALLDDPTVRQALRRALHVLAAALRERARDPRRGRAWTDGVRYAANELTAAAHDLRPLVRMDAPNPVHAIRDAVQSTCTPGWHDLHAMVRVNERGIVEMVDLVVFPNEEFGNGQ